MKDKQGREYAKLSVLKEGDLIQVDGDFTCLEPWSEHTVQKDNDGLFIPCRSGTHHLGGQADDGENCVGIYNVPQRS